jgi:hypothetical protein
MTLFRKFPTYEAYQTAQQLNRGDGLPYLSAIEFYTSKWYAPTVKSDFRPKPPMGSPYGGIDHNPGTPW